MHHFFHSISFILLLYTNKWFWRVEYHIYSIIIFHIFLSNYQSIQLILVLFSTCNYSKLTQHINYWAFDSVNDEVYSRNTSCTLNLISMFVFLFVLSFNLNKLLLKKKLTSNTWLAIVCNVFKYILIEISLNYTLKFGIFTKSSPYIVFVSGHAY